MNYVPYVMLARLQVSSFILGYKVSFQTRSQRTWSNVDNMLPLDLEITMLFYTAGRDPIFPQLTLAFGTSPIVSEIKILQKEITITAYCNKKKKYTQSIYVSLDSP